MRAFASSKTKSLGSFAPEFAADVRAGLTKSGQKELHSRYLYDALGSALFEAITLLPEYGLTRADARLLRSFSSEIAGGVRGPVQVAELGSGSGQKTRYLLQALRRRQGQLRYSPIDVSAAALAHCERELGSLAEIRSHEESYLPGLTKVAQGRRDGETLLVLFLGSTIGNFERLRALDFLKGLRALLRPGDALLLGADLVKPHAQLIDAYDDPTGVTAAFNLNLLARVNRELDGDFDLRAFEHRAIYNAGARRIEMHLRARRSHSVHIRDAGLTVPFREGETIWTESSHKFEVTELASMARETGFGVTGQWIDSEWPFAENLWTAV